MRCYDIETHGFLWENKAESRGEILGVTPENFLVEIVQRDNILRMYDVKTGEMTERTLEWTPAEGYNQVSRDTGITELAGNQLITLLESFTTEVIKNENGSFTVNVSEESKWEICLTDLKDGTQRRFDAPQLADLISREEAIVANEDGSKLLIIWTDKEKQVFCGILDSDTGVFSSFETSGFLPEYGDAVALWNNEHLAFRDAEGMWLYDHSAGERKSLESGNSNAISAFFTEDGRLMVLDENLMIRVYDCKTAQLLHTSEILSTGYSLSPGTDVQWDIHGNILMVNANAVCTLINMDTWEPYSYVRNVLCFDHANDAFCVYVYDDNSLAYYRRYTTDMLIQRAKELLGNNELSQQLREQYGLID